MKIIQFISDENEKYYGLIDSMEERTAWKIEGDIFKNFSVTAQKMKIKKVLPPVYPPNILAMGLNYRKHADETGAKYPEIPVVFLKATNTVIGNEDAIVLPRIGPDEVDYEAELAIIIGTAAKNVPAEKALDYILGYTCANDVSARDWQIEKQKKQWARGKSFDAFCPLGPYIVTKDDIPNPNNLRIQTIINGNVYQDSNTSDMIFNVSTIVSNLSQSITLYPGTVLLTGTPEGVGFIRKPPVFLKEGDSVSIIIERIGELRNPVVKEK